MVKVVAGIDISKASLDICAAGQTRRFANDATSWERQANWRKVAGESPAGRRSNQPLPPRVMDRAFARMQVKR